MLSNSNTFPLDRNQIENALKGKRTTVPPTTVVQWSIYNGEGSPSKLASIIIDLQNDICKELKDTFSDQNLPPFPSKVKEKYWDAFKKAKCPHGTVTTDNKNDGENTKLINYLKSNQLDKYKEITASYIGYDIQPDGNFLLFFEVKQNENKQILFNLRKFLCEECIGKPFDPPKDKDKDYRPIFWVSAGIITTDKISEEKKVKIRKIAADAGEKLKNLGDIPIDTLDVFIGRKNTNTPKYMKKVFDINMTENIPSSSNCLTKK